MAKFYDQSIRKYLAELGSDRAIPGGGSAAALTGALGNALSLMVARFSVRRQKTVKDQRGLARLTQALIKLEPQIARVIDEDPKIFSKVAKCYSIERKADTEGKKKAATMLMDQALSEAFQVQAKLAFLLVMALRVNKDLEPLASGSVKNDLNVSRSLFCGAYEGAISTCEINLKYLTDAARKKLLTGELQRIQNDFRKVNNG